MDQKAFTIAFVVITVIAVLGIIISRMIGNSTPAQITKQTATISPSPQSQANASNLPQASVKKVYSVAPTPLAAAELRNKKAVIQTAKGIIEFEIYPEATAASSNFIFLAQDGFYNGLKFHRVEPGFVIQGGDPLGNGSGGPGYTFREEKLIKDKYEKGVVAYAKRANEPAGTVGSQFFIMIEEKALPLEYVIFGKVNKGQDVVSKITVGDVMESVSIENLK